MEWIFAIILLLFCLFLWAVTGHGIWVVARAIFSGFSSRSCPACRHSLAFDDKACRHCGWTSTKVDAREGLSICRMAINGALQRQLIDHETMQRGLEILEKLEHQLDLERRGQRPARQSPAAMPTSSPVPAVPVTQKTPQPIEGSTDAEVASSKAESRSTPESPAVRMPPPAIPENQVHALDREYESSKPIVAPKLKPERTWTQWMSAFLEESNIRWGELVGGLLIVCCSVALVISFWEHIASRPWLKFSIFTGINIATFGLGLYAWHRWKLPTTSKGILVIGLMLLPLNFLAFALLTLGMPWDWFTVGGEMASLAVLGVLAWQASKVLTPTAVWITTLTPIAFALANLLIRRTVSEDAGVPLLYGWSTGLLGLYTVANGIAWKPLLKRAEGRFAPAVEFFALATFSILIASGLLLRCTGTPMESFRLLSPLLSLLAAPSLFLALDISRRLEKGSSLTLPMILLGAGAIGVGGASMLFATPMPLRMIGAALGWLALVGVAAIHFRHAGMGYPFYLISSLILVLGWYGFTGRLAWTNESPQTLLQAISTPNTGFLWVGWSLVCGAASIALARLRLPGASLTALRSAGILGVLGTIVLTALGLGREQYAMSVGSVYGIYAAASFAIGMVRKKPWIEGIGIVFLAAAAVQWIAVGWVDAHWILRAFACFAGVATFLLLVMMIRQVIGQPANKDSTLSAASLTGITLTSLTALAWFFLAESTSWIDGAPFSISTWIFASLLWFLLVWVQPDSNHWRIAQGTAIAGCVLEVVLRSQLAPWWSEGENSYLHPLFVQYASLALFLCGGLLIGLDAWLQRIGRSSLAAIAGPLPSLHDSSVARYAIASATIATMGLLVYGALPGTLQELIPRNALSTTELTSFIQDGDTHQRLVPALSALELHGIPHAAASWGIGSEHYRVWGLPPMWGAWGVGLLALVCVLWNERRSGAKSMASWLGVAITLGLALWYPIASQFEPSVSVASSLRWLTAIFFFVSSLALSVWIRRVDRAAEPEASRSFARFDHAFAVFSVNTLVPWIAMIAILGISVLWRVEVMPWTVWTWVITGSMAAFSFVLLTLQFNRAQNASNNQVRSVAAITAATLMAAPLVTWVIFLIAVTVIAHPLTGPNPDSFFARIGLAGSYAIPILLISAALVSVSAARPSPHLAFVSAIFLMVTVVVGYMLILKSNGVRVEAWVGLAAALAATSSIFSIVWRAYTARDTRSDALLHWSGRPAHLVRQEWQTALKQVSAGFILVGLFLTVGIVLYQPISMPGLTSMSGLTWASAGILASIGILMGERILRRELSNLAPWIGAVGIAGMGLAAPLWGSVDHSLTYSAVAMALTGGAMIANSARRAQGRTERLNAFPFLFWILCILACLSIRLVFERIRFAGPGTSVGFLPVAILIAAWGLGIANAWLHRDRWSWLCSLLLAQGAGLIFTVWYWNSPVLITSRGWNTVFVQCAIMAISSGTGTLLGFGRRVRIPLVFATVFLALCSGAWLFYALEINPTSALQAFPSGSYVVAIAACLLSGATGYWNPRSRDENAVVYVSGLCGAVWMLQAFVPYAGMIPWLTTIFLAAYCLATSFLWRSGSRLHEEIASLIRIPKTEDKPPAKMVVEMNILLALVVAWMGVAAQFQQEILNLRFICAQSIMAVAFAVGILARYVSLRFSPPRLLETSDGQPVGSTPIRVLALVLGVLYAVTLFWHIQPIESTTLLDRMSVALLPLTLIGTAYAFGLIKGMGLKQEWEQAAFAILPWIVTMAIVGGMACLAIEYQQSRREVDFNFALYPTLCIAFSFALAMVLCVGAALLPGRDPLGLTERGRESYVYTAQAVLVLLVIHCRLAFPWLFSGLLQQIWPLLLLIIGFVGIAMAEWSQRRGWLVLANPLRNSGGLLPLLPIVAPWLAESRIDYGVTLVTAAVGYGLFGFMKRSPFYIALSAMTANGAIWYLLHRNEFSFAKHPQLWVIPPALCVFAAAQFARRHLSASQVAMARYASIGAIYVASTSEIFLQGISKAPWLPIVLAFLSVLGILFGIAARIRSMLWLGSMFLCVALFSILWYAAVDLEQTWIWYVSGIILGAIILIVFALFEKRREDLKRIMSSMQRWEE